MHRVNLERRRLLTRIFAFVCFVTLVGSTVSFSVSDWVKTTATDMNTVYTGLFLNNGHHQFLCDGNMSVAECGYLKGSKASGIISGIFGLFAMLVLLRYLKAEGVVTSLGATIAGSCGFLQTAFAVICVVYYSYLKNSYFDYDDLNVEYANNESTSYERGFFLMCVVTALSFVYSAGLIGYFVYVDNDHGARTAVEYRHLAQH